MYLSEEKSRELLDLKKKWGFDDPRFHNENCDLCGNSAFREGYKENIPVQRAFEPAPDYPGYLQKPCGEPCEQKPAEVSEDLVRMITQQVMAALGKA
jgi:L-fuculose-phosphate aldolase